MKKRKQKTIQNNQGPLITSTETRLPIDTHASAEAQPQSSPEMLQVSQQKISRTMEYTTIIIGWILQGGVLLSAAIILIGMLLLPFHSRGLSEQSLVSFPHTLAEEWTGLLALRPQAVIVLGLLLLIATPVMRVAVSVVAFAIERDYRYVVITLLVLAILIASFLIGKGGG